MAQPIMSMKDRPTSLVPLGDIRKNAEDARNDIVTMILLVPHKGAAQELRLAVEGSVEKLQTLLGHVQEVDQVQKNCLDRFCIALREIQSDVKYWTDSSFTARARQRARNLIGRQKHENVTQCRAKVLQSYLNVESVFPPSIQLPTSTRSSIIGQAQPSTPSSSTPQPPDTMSAAGTKTLLVEKTPDKAADSEESLLATNTSEKDGSLLVIQPSNHSWTIPQAGISTSSLLSSQTPGARSTTEPEDLLLKAPADEDEALPAHDDRSTTLISATKNVLQLASNIAGIVPDPISKTLKLIADTGLSIITMLQNMDSNQKDALKMARHVAHLLQSIQQFLQDLDDVDDDTLKALATFQRELVSVQERLTEFKDQGRFKRGIAHEQNKADLGDCAIQIDRAFKELHAHLTLRGLRLLTEMNATDARRERDRLLDRLGGADYGVGSKAADPDDLLCLPGTRKDLLNEVDRWIDDPFTENILWINGVAGCGKTAVAATIAHRQQESSATVATFHFDRSNQKRNESVICSLSRWLARSSHDSLERSILQSIQDEPDIAVLPLTTQFERLLVIPMMKLASSIGPAVPVRPPMKLAQSLAPTVLVIDALDEWYNHNRASAFINLIRKHAWRLPSQVKFVITSRDEGYLANSFRSKSVPGAIQPTPVKIIQLDHESSTDVDRDIESFLTARFATIRSHSEDPAISRAEWPGIECIKDLVVMSTGLFQWVATSMRYIEATGRHAARLQDIRRSPNQLGGLDTLYRRILELLFKEDDTRPATLSLLQDVLGYLAMAEVPISLNMIVYLQANSRADTDDVKKEIQDEILAVLGSFLIVPDSPNQPIGFLHPSFVEFITDPQRCRDDCFLIKRSFHQGRIASSILQRMNRDLRRNICQIEDPSKPNVEVQDDVKKFIPTGLQYACHYWADHLSKADLADQTPLLNFLRQFCEVYLLNWLEVLSLIGQMNIAVAVVNRAEQCLRLSPSSTSKAVGELLRDAQRFVAVVSKGISQRAMHIYISAIAHIPTETAFARQYARSAVGALRVLHGPVGTRWPASVWVSDNGDSCRDLRFSPDGKMIVSASDNGMVRVWDTDSGMANGEPLVGHSKPVTSIAFSPDGKMIASASSDRTVRVWDSNSRVEMWADSAPVTTVVFSPDGKLIASASDDHCVRVWTADSGMETEMLLKGHLAPVTSVVFSPDGKMIASASTDTTVRLWHADSCLAKGDPLVGHSNGVYSIAFSPDSRLIASVSDDSTVRIWHAAAGKAKGKPMIGHSRFMTSVIFSPDGKIIASASRDTTIRLWHAGSGIAKGGPLVGHSNGVTSIAFSPDGKMIASASDDSTVRVWDAYAGEVKGEPLVGHLKPVSSVAFSPDGKMIASASGDKTIRLWSVDSESSREKLEGHSDWVSCVVFSPDGRLMASASEDHTIRLWDMALGMARGSVKVPRVHTVEFSQDGGTIIAYDQFRFKLKKQAVELFTTTRPHQALAADITIALLRRGSTDTLAPFPTTDLGETIQDGWIYVNGRRWFWLPDGFSRDAQWQRYEDRVIITQGQHIYILDVSEITYLVDAN